MPTSTNIFDDQAICASDGQRVDNTKDLPWLCALLLRWPPGARLVEFPLPLAKGEPQLHACAFLLPGEHYVLPLNPAAPFEDDIPPQGSRALRRSTLARYLTGRFYLRREIPKPFRRTEGSLTLVSSTDSDGRATGDLLVRDGRITDAGKRLRATIDPPLGQPLDTAEHVIPFLVLPDSDPATWEDHFRFCPLHGQVHPITLRSASPAWTWSHLCGREFTRHACPRCLYRFESFLSAMN